MRVLFASAEVSPFAKTGGLGDVCGALPKALAQLRHDVVVFTPWYAQTRSWYDRHPHVARPEIVMRTTVSWAGWSAEMFLLRSVLPGSSVPVYFVGNDFYFDRAGIYDLRGDGFDDNLERFTFFNRAVIAACEALGLTFDIVHAHDWHTAPLTMYLHSGLRSVPNFASAASVFTIHNFSYQGRFPGWRFGFTGLHSSYMSADTLEYYGDVNFMKGALTFSDQITTVSPTYAREIQEPEFGAGLDGWIRTRAFKLTGILNGIDTDEWDPSNDEDLDANYEKGRMLGKKVCKRMLCRELGLPFNERAPVIGFVSRLVEQKGIDLFLPILPHLLERGAQFIALGTGEPRYEEAFRYYANLYPDHVVALMTFDEALAHRIFAASDLFLVPSRFEPCGLNQMYALRYGALPIVRMTGGLADSVVPYDGANRAKANGFGFQAAETDELRRCADYALTSWKDWRVRKKLQENAMTHDFSWDRSARAYEGVFTRALKG